ncbi:ABC transporter substrate-binding protein [Limimaricola hongkongensis]|uniref:Oligopeptide/dipeptide ABC transporter, periplasmic substrate-binding protein n=1 Tax=Limimaricola hongkongensis DSM 17492 TaxID=1122180 RepID=A0A017HBR5_9RHOB|nr:ABC transporter substrate-binding protein [Limimaricola hongkongensis]EYD71755.1 Oligopeptide/dipeptide ABC transporter, periplasmic substrate-binding protein [Limimaricola hongkongensis DSM 17492]
MTIHDTFGAKLHPAARMYATEHRAGQLSRREFLTRATALGVGASAAYGLIGLPTPARADAHAEMGGTLRMEMETKAMKDPRLADWGEIHNFYRGWLDYLVQYEADGAITPMLLESWEANDDATQFTLKVREGVTWNNGDPFTADDVARNIALWCDGTVEGNTMASRMVQLVDPETDMARDGAIEVVNDLTVRLNLAAPDITVIVSMADYPAAIVHSSFDGGDPSVNPIGTGAYLPEVNEVGVRQVLARNTDHTWWGTKVFGGPYLDRIEYIDYGTDPAAKLAAAESGEIDITYETTGDFIDIFDAIGWQKSEVVTASTIVVRFNQDSPPFDNRDVRRALQMAVDNKVVLELGYNGRGEVADNHHVCPIHPEYAPVDPPVHDPAAAKAMLDAAGFGEETFELISLDDAWQAATSDAVAAQLRDAGIDVQRRVMPGSTFWNGWLEYPFSATDWAMRPLGVQVLALAYKSGVPWNETAYASEEFDALLAEAMSLADVEERRAVMAKIETLLQEDGVVIQPYWRSIFRHFTDKVQGADMHPSFEHHHYKWWVKT